MRRSWALGAALLFSMAYRARIASAQAPPTPGAERAMAEGLFQDGRKALQAGDVAEACRKFAASYRIDAAGGTLMNLASCHEREGKTATAWAEFKEALVGAARQNNRVRQDEARERVAALEKRLSRLVLTAPPGPPIAGLEVRVDGVPVDADGRSALPLDPGSHVISATAPGRKPWRGDAVVSDGGTSTFAVGALEVDSAGGAAPLPVAPVTATPTGPALLAQEPPRAPAQAWRTPVGATLLVIGGAGLVVGAVAGGLVLSQHGSLASSCVNGVCPNTPANASDLSSYHAKSTASTVGFVAGGAFAVAGIVVLATAPKKRDSEPAAGLFVGPAAAGVSGRF